MFKIETPRLILRDLLEVDFPSFFELCCDPGVKQFQDFLWVENEEKALALLKSIGFHNKVAQRRAYNLAIIRKQGMVWMGWMGFSKADDPAIGDFEFGYALLKNYRGNGFMTEALLRVIEYCFKELGIEKIYGGCLQENIASIRVMEKAGLRLEEVNQEIDEASGIITYARRYCMTRDEWKSLKLTE